ncbi:FixH family protein [Ornithinibacillus scapharcae]|uniref:FixH family protein n=1 Tax=Ornithinibacillus scapharcae TaxID=1147159 RepID=UPI000225BE21|nr:FixH family protein [Ornithinibacillus scapharcae]
MKKITYILLLSLFLLVALAACGNEEDNEKSEKEEELKTLDVVFDVPEKAAVGESVELKATVTYGDEKVVDADEVEFEYWLQGNEDDSITVEANNNEDGTYTAEVSFDADGIYEMYAHTTARELHTMPKKSITIGEGVNTEHDAADHEHESEGHEHGSEDHEHGHHAEGFKMEFIEPASTKVNSDTELSVHLHLDGKPLEGAQVRYEILSDDETTEWVSTVEVNPGEYTVNHTFTKAGTYHMTVHVENDEGLHEHEEYELEIK